MIRPSYRFLFAALLCAMLTPAGVAGALGRRAVVDHAVVAAGNNISTAEEATLSAGFREIQGQLTAGTVDDVVYKVYMAAGESLTAWLSASPSTDFGLYGFGPTATNVATDEPVDWEDPRSWGGFGYPQQIDLIATTSGWHYIDVWTGLYSNGGSGSFTLRLSSKQTTTTVSPSKFANYGGSGVVSGTVTSSFVDTVTGPVALYKTTNDGMTFTRVGTTELVDGAYTFNVTGLATKTYFIVEYVGDGSLKCSDAETYFLVRPSLSRPVAPSIMYRNRRATVYSYLKPRHKAGSYPVRIYKQRYVNGTWKSYGYVNARALSGSDKCSVSMSLPYRGRWRVRAYHSDAGHVGTYTTYDYIWVR